MIHISVPYWQLTLLFFIGTENEQAIPAGAGSE